MHRSCAQCQRCCCGHSRVQKYYGWHGDKLMRSACIPPGPGPEKDDHTAGICRRAHIPRPKCLQLWKPRRSKPRSASIRTVSLRSKQELERYSKLVQLELRQIRSINSTALHCRKATTQSDAERQKPKTLTVIGLDPCLKRRVKPFSSHFLSQPSSVQFRS